MKKLSILSLAILTAAVISACSSAPASSAGTPGASSAAAPASSAASQAAVQSAPDDSKSGKMNAEDIAKALKESSLPIDNIIVYTEDNDVNSLLGRPNQYISKVNFADTTVDQGDDKENPVGGSVETFNNADDLKTRKDYCESISKSSPMFAQYYYVNGNYLLRIDNAVKPADAKKYEDAFSKLK